MMQVDVLIAIIIGIISGWTITVFCPPWKRLSNQFIVKIKPKSKLQFYFLESIMDLIGFIILITIVLLVSVFV